MRESYKVSTNSLAPTGLSRARSNAKVAVILCFHNVRRKTILTDSVVYRECLDVRVNLVVSFQFNHSFVAFQIVRHASQEMEFLHCAFDFGKFFMELWNRRIISLSCGHLY